MRLLHVLSAAGVALYAGIVSAQCPDGTPPPCVGMRTPTPTDPNVIAILPFRVSGADRSLAYLRDGLVELLAAEFTGEGGPRAVDPGVTLLTWSNAGGNRSHLTADAARGVARKLGAGQVLLGAVVGTPRRVTLTASIYDVAGREVRVQPVVIEGTADSLASIVGSLSARLLARRAGVWNISANDPGTMSSEALRAYVAGRAAIRAGQREKAIGHLTRALELDSTFAFSAYWLTMLDALNNGAPNPREFQLAWSQRHRLGAERRLLLEMVFGPTGRGSGSSEADLLHAREKAAEALPRSAEAWYLVGDQYFHFGGLLGYSDWMVRAKAAFERAFALDTLPGVAHLVTLAFLEGDFSRHARLVDVLARVQPEASMTLWERYMEALKSGSRGAARAARRRFAGSPQASYGWPWVAGVPLPITELDSLLRDLATFATTQDQREAALFHESRVASNAGQPERALRARRKAFGGDSLERELEAVSWAEHDSAAAEQLSSFLRQATTPPNAWRMHCEIVLSRLRRADTSGVARILTTLRSEAPPGAQLCFDLTTNIVASLPPKGTAAPLFRSDSVLRRAPRGAQQNWNHDLGLAFARHGEWRAAATATRRRSLAWPVPLAVSMRDLGRWSALAGDTATAVQAFRRYLGLREQAEPAIRPEVDSIRVELLRLTPARKQERKVGVTGSGR